MIVPVFWNRTCATKVESNVSISKLQKSLGFNFRYFLAAFNGQYKKAKIIEAAGRCLWFPRTKTTPVFFLFFLGIYRFFRVRNGATHFFTKQGTAAFIDMVYFDNARGQRDICLWMGLWWYSMSSYFIFGLSIPNYLQTCYYVIQSYLTTLFAVRYIAFHDIWKFYPF